MYIVAVSASSDRPSDR